MSCRERRVLSKCGQEAATFSHTFSELLSETLYKALDTVYHADGVTPIFLNDETLKRSNY